MKIAIPNKGRMSEPAVELLREAGIKVDITRGLLSKFKDIDILFVRAQDIPEYVQDGAADLGVTGRDVVLESGAKVNILMSLGFGKAKLVVAVPKNSKIKSLKDITSGLKVATEFPNLTKKFFKKINKKVEVVNVSGATEITPYLGISDIIVDLTSTGTTLEMNNLKVISEIMETEAILIGNKKYKDENMVLSLSSVIFAKNKRYIMVNVPVEKLEEIKRIIPGMESPTVMSLAESDYVAVHSVIDEDEIFSVIKKLKKAGGKDILVLPIERVVK